LIHIKPSTFQTLVEARLTGERGTPGKRMFSMLLLKTAEVNLA